MNHINKGFTLIEVSIVLILIGLIMGSLVAMQELINQSRIRGLIKDITNIQTSINVFKYKYVYMPGDFSSAGAIWQNTECDNSSVPTGCNGDGNWQIDSGDYSNGSEIYRFWQHLNLAGMIPGTYTSSNSFNNQFQSSYSVTTRINARYTTPFINSVAYNMLEIGGWSNLNIATNGSIKPSDTSQVDQKIDDGIANSGHVFGLDGIDIPAALCSYSYNNDANGLANYNLIGAQGNYCRMKVMIN